MAEVKILEPPPALYDHVLYHECASRDWTDYKKKITISGNGSLINFIKWDSKPSNTPGDRGGDTLFGVTKSTWTEFVRTHANKGYNSDLNTMGKQGWFDVIKDYWSKCSADKCANYACAFVLFQMRWVGMSSDGLKTLLNTLKTNADIKDYNYTTSKSIYKKIADATHAYTDPMIAYDYLRKANSAHFYNISTPDKTDRQFRCGWLTRSALSFTPYGLYVPVSVSYDKTGGLSYYSSIKEWEDVAMKWVQENKSGYVKIMDWGTSPESIAKMTSNPYNYMSGSGMDSSNSMYGYQNGIYSGYGSTSIGNYTNNEKIEPIEQLYKKREEVLNTLINGSYIPDGIIKCAELISSDKRKGETY